MADPTIPIKEFAARRKQLCASLHRAVGVVFAGEHRDALTERYRPDPDFEYLTGVTDEPGAVLLLDPTAPDEPRREVLFLAARDPERERWEGARLGLGAALRERTGFQTVQRLGQLPRFLTAAVLRSRKVACLHPPAAYTQPVSPDLALFRKVAERIVGVEIIDAHAALVDARAVKSKAEIAMIQHAVDVTAGGFDAAFAAVRPGVNEAAVQLAVEHAYRSAGSSGPAFGTIVGGGFNATVLHYGANDQPLVEGDLVCIDSGAAWGGYGADVTRTVPVSGTFSERQREVYDVVLAALEAATKAVKPGVRLADLDKIARAVITRAGFGDAFIHSIGHHLGLRTHDVAPDGGLREGAVVTIEPGIYLPEENLGVRIEDDVAVTKTGHKVLSAKIPRKAADVEKAMAG